MTAVGSHTTDLLIVGSANVDLTVEVDRHPRPGETVLGGDTRTSPGGKGANVAVAAARRGGRVAMLGAVGNDANGELLRRALTGAGVDVSHLRRIDGPSGAAYITLSRGGENMIVVSPGANARVRLADVDAAAATIGTTAVVFAVLEISMATVCHAAARAVAAGARVVLNASPVADLPRELVNVLDPLVVNRHEAVHLLGGAEQEPGDLARGLLELGARSAVVTLGPDGAVCADAEGVTAVSAPQVDVVDTTGAGDAFSGALCIDLARGASLQEAVRTAVDVAADAVTRYGAQPPES